MNQLLHAKQIVQLVTSHVLMRYPCSFPQRSWENPKYERIFEMDNR